MKLNKTTKVSIVFAAILGSFALMGASCGSDADTVSENISTEAEKFNVQRTIIVTSGITGEPIALIEGRCSFELNGQRADFICKYGPDEYRKSTAKIGDQDSIFIAMEKPIDVSEYHTKFVIRPESLLPEFDIQIGEDE